MVGNVQNTMRVTCRTACLDHSIEAERRRANMTYITADHSRTINE